MAFKINVSASYIIFSSVSQPLKLCEGTSSVLEMTCVKTKARNRTTCQFPVTLNLPTSCSTSSSLIMNNGHATRVKESKTNWI